VRGGKGRGRKGREGKGRLGKGREGGKGGEREGRGKGPSPPRKKILAPPLFREVVIGWLGCEQSDVI